MTWENLWENIRNLTDILKWIRDELENLKNNSNNIDTMLEKANDLLKKAKDAESKLKAEIDKVKSTDLVDESIKLAKEKAEELLKIDITKEIQNLLNSIKTTITDQNIFSKTKNRIWEQWNAVLDSNKWWWNKEGWKNVLRTTWFLITWAWWLWLAWYLAYQWGKKVYNWIKRRWKQKFWDPLEDTKVKNEIEIPTEWKDVEAKDLIDWLPKDATVEFWKGSGVDITKEWEQEVILVVKLWDKEKKILATIEIKDGKITIKDKKDSKDNKEERKDKKDKDKKLFWDRWYWKALKYSIIGTPIYYIVHWMATGRWSLEELFKRNNSKPDSISTAEDQVVWVEKLKEENPENFEKYKELWENIDSQYNQLMEKEINSWWWGMSIADWYAKYCDISKLSLSDFKATVPMCIDNQFSTVSDMLSEGGYYAYLRSKNFAELKDVFMHMLTDWSQKLIWSIFPFFGCLKSFEKYKDKDFLESVKTWLDDWTPTERCEELQLFFRQYAKVISYVQDKRLAVIEKIAERKFAIAWDAWVDNSKYATIEDAIKDPEWFEKNIESDSEYQDFMQWKITHAIDVMKKESIFDDNISGIVKEVKNWVDGLRWELLNEKDWKDVLIRLKENKESLTDDNYKEWTETADKVYSDIEDYFEKDWTYMYFSSAHTLVNSDEKNIQEFIENSWLKVVKDNLKTKLLEYKTKFNNKTITSNEIDEYNDLINSYFAMKKEVMVASSTIQMMKSNDASRTDRALNVWAAILTDFFNQSRKSWEELRDWNYWDAWLYWTFPMIAAWFALRKYGNPPKVYTISDWRKIYWVNKRLFAKQAKILWDMLLKLNPIGIAPAAIEWAYKLTGNVFRRTSHIYGLNAEFLRHTRYNIEHWDELLFQDVLEWRIWWIKAENIARKWCKKWKVSTTSQRSLESFIQTMSWEKISLTEKQISDLFKTKINIWGKEFDISFMKNETIRNKILVSTWNEWWWKKPINWYYRRYYDYSKTGENAKTLWFWELFWWADWWVSKIPNLSDNQLILLRKIVEDWNFTDPAKQLKSLFENIDKIDLKDVSEKNLIKIIEELWNNPTELEDLSRIQNKVNKFKIINIPPERLNQPIFWEIDNVKHELEDLMKSETNAAKKTQIKQQINQIEDFKRELWTIPDDEFKITDSLIECFKWAWTRKTLNEVITDITKLKKIMDIDGRSLTTAGSGHLKVIESIDDILKDVDNAALKLRKAKKFHPEIAIELEDIAKIFEQIKLKNASKVLWSADDILSGIKILVKLARVA